MILKKRAPSINIMRITPEELQAFQHDLKDRPDFPDKPSKASAVKLPRKPIKFKKRKLDVNILSSSPAPKIKPAQKQSVLFWRKIRQALKAQFQSQKNLWSISSDDLTSPPTHKKEGYQDEYQKRYIKDTTDLYSKEIQALLELSDIFQRGMQGFSNEAIKMSQVLDAYQKEGACPQDFQKTLSRLGGLTDTDEWHWRLGTLEKGLSDMKRHIAQIERFKKESFSIHSY